ncbi:MAG: uridine kinase [Bacteroidetes bacterium]|nr:uridine kinase [Bacteroidota bacterium]
MKNIIIGIAGGSGSGKSTVTNRIIHQLGKKSCVVIAHDSYYKSLPENHNPLEYNFDHPDALHTDELVDHLTKLKNGKQIHQPHYDFSVHKRLKKTNLIKAHKIIILEGILILSDKRVRELMDIKIFVDTDADERLIRRIRRDILERDRTLDSVIDQYNRTVKPMHIEFVEPSKVFADIIIPRGGENHVAIDLIVSKIRSL